MNTALLTGSNRGIGLALSRQLATRGFRVLATCREVSPALTELSENFEHLHPIAGIDVTQPESWNLIREQWKTESIDWLLCNAGLYIPTELGSMELQDIQTQWNVNTLGVLQTVQALLPFMNEGGRIGLLSSRFGSLERVSTGGYYGYRMSKAALNMLGRCLAYDLKPRSIAVALLHPGYVKTEMNEGRGDLTTEESATGLLHVMEALTVESTGRFWNVHGEELPW